MAAACALHPIPHQGARHRGDLFSVALDIRGLLTLRAAGAGISPRRASNFLSRRRKKVTKGREAGLRSLRAAKLCGDQRATPLWRSGFAGLLCGARCGQAAAELAFGSDSPRRPSASLRATCPPLRSSTPQRGPGTASRAIATLGPVLDVRLLAVRLRRWQGRAAQRRADQGSPLSERSEFGRYPARREQRRGARRAPGSGSPFFCLLFFGEAKNK